MHGGEIRELKTDLLCYNSVLIPKAKEQLHSNNKHLFPTHQLPEAS